MPGTKDPLGPDVPDAEVAAIADTVGYPILIKAVAGGGGKGMRTVTQAADLPGSLRAARSEALSSFGDPRVYIERRILKPRHIEIQLLGDQHGTVLPFVERECSIQRRHQKVVEESPSTVVSPELRRQMAGAAAAVARRVGYSNAGTIEFLLDESGEFFFLEMNTRLQVEHPITELVTGTDLVHWQIRIARGERLTLDPDALLTPVGHAIECRIYAEDPDRDFLPSPGLVTALRAPAGPGIRRDDGGAVAGVVVPVFYDPLIAKLATWAETGRWPSPAWRARWTSTTCAASRRPSRSSAGCWRSRTSSPAGSTPPTSTRRSPRATAGRSSRCPARPRTWRPPPPPSRRSPERRRGRPRPTPRPRACGSAPPA